MRIVIAHAEEVGGLRPDAAYADGLAEAAVACGHQVECLVLPASGASPQQRALACHLLPTDLYGDALWSLNFPACVLRHPRRQIWFTRAAPFGDDPRAPAHALRALIAQPSGTTRVSVVDDALAQQLGLTDADVGRDAPPLRGAASRPAAERQLALWMDVRA